MGGKSKQAQRTKNNVRPSSSGRSAELLGTGGAGWGAAGGAALFPSLAAVAPDVTLSPDLAVCIKKLNKKDPITKAKALQELNELVQNSKVEDVVSMLPNWSHFYKQLSVDPDRRVRELTQVCHGTVVGVCGRRVAPHLRALLPSWLAAQHDDHAPARSRAQLTLHSTFPESKLPDAISFCKTEIITHMVDNLLDPNAAVSRKLDSAEERVAGGARVAGSALGGLRAAVRLLPAAHGAWLWERLDALLAANAFWKLAAHDAPEVRSAWYSAVGALAERFGAGAEGVRWAGAAHGGRALRVMLAARETGTAAHALWTAVVQLLRADPEWHSRLEKKTMDLLCKRVVETARAGAWGGGGGGGARAAGGVLPALLQLLPPPALQPPFPEQLFDAFVQGLEKRSVIGSKSERGAWLACVCACVDALAGGGGAGGGGGGGAALDGLRRVVGAALAWPTADRDALVTAAAEHVLKLLIRWARDPQLELCVRAFWQGAAATMRAQIAAPPPPAPTAPPAHADDTPPPPPPPVHAHVIFLLAVHRGLNNEPKKRCGVRFQDEAELPADSEGAPEGGAVRGAGAGAVEREVTPPGRTDDEVTSLLRHQLRECVSRVCCACVERAGAGAVGAGAGALGAGAGPGGVRGALRALCPLLEACADEQLWADIGAAATQRVPATAMDAWVGALGVWLRGEQSRCEEALRAALLLLPHLTHEQQAIVFADIDQMGAPVCDWALRVCARGGGVGAGGGVGGGGAARAWVRGADGARAALLRAARGALAGDAAHTDTLLACLHAHDGERAVSPAAVCEVVQLVAYVLTAGEGRPAPAPPATAPAPAAPLAARLLHALAAGGGGGGAPDDALRGLVTALCQYDLTHDTEAGAGGGTAEGAHGGGGDEWSVRGAWVRGLRAAAGGARGALVDHLARIIREHLPTDTNSLCEETTERCAQVAALVAAEAPGGGGGAGAGVWATLAGEDAGGEGREDACVMMTHALRHDVVSGALTCPFADADPVRPLADEYDQTDAALQLSRAVLVRWARGVLLRASFVRAARLAHASLSPDHQQLCLDTFKDYAILLRLKDGYAFWSEYETLERAERAVGAALDAAVGGAGGGVGGAGGGVGGAGGEHVRRLADELHRRGLAHGYYWAVAAAWFRRRYLPADDTTSPPPQPPAETDLTADGFFHTLQAEQMWSSPGAHAGGEGDPAGGERDPAGGGAGGALEAAGAVAVRCLLAAHAPRLPAPAAPPATPAAAADALVDAYYNCEDTMLYDADIVAAPWSAAVYAGSAARFLARLVAETGWHAPAHHWDFATISATSLLASAARSAPHWGDTKVSLVSVGALRLLGAVSAFVGAVGARAVRELPPAHVGALPAEWRDVFAPTATHHFYHLLLHILEEVSSSPDACPMTAARARVVSALCDALGADGGARWDALGASSRAALSLERGVRAAGAVLAAPTHHGYKYLAYYTLRALAEPIVLHDAEKLREWSAQDGGGGGAGAAGADGHEAPPPACGARPPLLFDLLLEPIAKLQELVDAALDHLRVGVDTCSTAPGSDTHSLALGYLLAWAALGGCARLQRGQLALTAAEVLRARRHTHHLLPNVLRLLPDHIAKEILDPTAPQPNVSLAAAPQPDDMFLNVKRYTVDEPACALDVGRLACAGAWVGVGAWGGGGGAARGWWGAAGAAAGRALHRLVRRHVAPHLVRAQLRAVADRAPADLPPGTDVRVHWTAGEVVCCVVIEERRVELSVSLSPEHPLSLPRVVSPQPASPHSPEPNTHWLAVYLAYQNGSLLNALRMWVSGVTARVEAAPQCYICYCRLHPATGRLPAAPCHTCRNKFHPECLRKWFSSSNKSNCPLCRASF